MVSKFFGISVEKGKIKSRPVPSDFTEDRIFEWNAFGNRCFWIRNNTRRDPFLTRRVNREVHSLRVFIVIIIVRKKIAETVMVAVERERRRSLRDCRRSIETAWLNRIRPVNECWAQNVSEKKNQRKTPWACTRFDPVSIVPAERGRSTAAHLPSPKTSRFKWLNSVRVSCFRHDDSTDTGNWLYYLYYVRGMWTRIHSTRTRIIYV